MPKEDLIHNLKKGLEIEHYAVDLCKELLNILEDKKDIQTVSLILSDEKKHVEIVKELINVTESNYIN